MKQKIRLIFSLSVIIIGLAFSLQVNAETVDGGAPETFSASPYSQVIALEPGWNIISTPRIVESHQFSAPETSENFSIYLLNASGSWSTMQDMNQAEFIPLFGYFILNKTPSTQALTLNYRQDVDPSQKLFDRQLTPGWNVIGIANPTYALRQLDSYSIGNVNSILNNTKDCLSRIVDFTFYNVDNSSVQVSDSWNYRNADDLSSLNNWRETKAYGVYVNTNCSYGGYQNNGPVETVSSSTPSGLGEITIVKNPNFDDQELVYEFPYDAEIGSFVITAGPNKGAHITGINVNLGSSTLDYANKTHGISICPSNSFCSALENSNNATDNYFTTDIIITAGSSKTIGVRLGLNNLEEDDLGKNIISSLSVTAKEFNSTTVIPTETTQGQVMTIGEISLPVTDPNEEDFRLSSYSGSDSKYLLGGLTQDNLLISNIISQNGDITIKQLMFKVVSSNSEYSPLATLSAYSGADWLGGSFVSANISTTTINVNFNISDWSNFFLRGQLNNVGPSANPSGIITSVSLVGIRYIDHDGIEKEKYYDENIHKSNNYAVYGAAPNIYLNSIPNYLTLGTSRVGNVFFSSNDRFSYNYPVKVKSLPIRITTNNVDFNTSPDSLIVTDDQGNILNTTNTSCASGECLINFMEPFIGTINIYLQDVVFTNEQPNGLPGVMFSLSNKNLFVWSDLVGGLSDITGEYLNWPNQTVATIKSISRDKAGYLLFGRDESFSSESVIAGETNVVLAKFHVKPVGEDMRLRELALNIINSGDVNLDQLRFYLNDTIEISSVSDIVSSVTTTIDIGSNYILEDGATSTISIVGNIPLEATNDDSYQIYLDINKVERLSSFDVIDPGVNVASNSISIIKRIASLGIAKNLEYGDQDVYSDTSRKKIGSFILAANGINPIGLSTININFGSSTFDYANKLSNLSIYVNGVQISSMRASVQTDNFFSVNYPINASSSVVLDIYVDIGNVDSENFNKIIVTSVSVSVIDMYWAVYISSDESVIGQTMTVKEITPPEINLYNSSQSLSGYAVGGTIYNNLVSYNIKSEDESIHIDEIMFKVNSDYYPLSLLSVDGFYRVVIPNTTTTMTGMNLSVPAGSGGININVGGQFNNIDPTSNPSGSKASISLVGIKYHTSAGHVKNIYYDNDLKGGNEYFVFSTKPIVSLLDTNSTLTLGMAEIARITISADAGGPIRLKSLPLNIVLDNSQFNSSENSLIVKDADGAVLPSTNAPCDSGNCVITFIDPSLEIDAGQSLILRVYAQGVNIIDGLLSSSTIITSLGDKNMFSWDDVNGNLNDINGQYYNNWPTSSQIYTRPL